MTANPAADHDFDWIIIGSGFGGSISALRLAERGYSVCVLECGRRFADEDLPKSAWQLRDFFWSPKLGMRGILRMTMFRDVAIISGAGVGGGSLVYAQTLYRATDRFRERVDAAFGEPVDLEPYYDVAERMLGVVDQPVTTSRDRLLKDVADDFGYPFHPTRIGVFRGTPGETVSDPYFGGEGPDRTGCIDCGQCIVSCRHNAKNSLTKNYLWLAERRGVRVEPERFVTDVRPIGADDGSDGYAVVAERPGAWARRDRRTLRARGVIFAAGAIGTNLLLANCRASGSLPAINDRLGLDVRTNAESVCAVTHRDRDASFSDGVSLSGSVWPNPDTHIEGFTYGGVGDAMALWFAPLTGDGNRITRPLKLLAQIARRPRDFLRSSNPRGWSKRSWMLGAMQTHDGAVRFESRRKLLSRRVRLQTRQDPDNPNPTFIPELHEFVERLAEKHDAIPQSWLTEAALNVPFTAHILGGAIVGAEPSAGVIDSRHRVYGYENLMVCDGSSVPYNPGVNPSLTIAALTERAMEQMPAKDGTPRTGGIGYAPLAVATP